LRRWWGLPVEVGDAAEAQGARLLRLAFPLCVFALPRHGVLIVQLRHPKLHSHARSRARAGAHCCACTPRNAAARSFRKDYTVPLHNAWSEYRPTWSCHLTFQINSGV